MHPNYLGCESQWGWGLCLRDRKGEMADFTLSNNHILCTLGARGFLREEPRSAISEARSGEERENREDVRKPLVTRDS